MITCFCRKGLLQLRHYDFQCGALVILSPSLSEILCEIMIPSFVDHWLQLQGFPSFFIRRFMVHLQTTHMGSHDKTRVRIHCF